MCCDSAGTGADGEQWAAKKRELEQPGQTWTGLLHVMTSQVADGVVDMLEEYIEFSIFYLPIEGDS